MHTPEFEFEKIPGNVLKAIKEQGITYPVVLDQEYYLWAYFNNQYWPAHYLFDTSGELIFESVGEDGTNELMEALSGLFHEKFPMMPKKNTNSGKATPEIYLGKNRGELGNSPACVERSCNFYSLPYKMEPGKVYLNGSWEQGGQFVESQDDNCSIYLDYKGASLTGVFDSDIPVEISCSIGGRTVKVAIDGPDTYNIFEGEIMEGTLVLEIPEGVRVYTLTFG